jgi:hypothetical protein
MVCCKVAKNRRLVLCKNLENPPHCHVPLMAWISKRSEAIESFDNDVFFDIEAKRTLSIVRKFISKRSEHVFIKEFNIEAKRSKLMLNCESSEAKRTCSIVKSYWLSLFLFILAVQIK